MCWRKFVFDILNIKNPYVILKIECSSFVELLIRDVFGACICNLLLNSILNEFPNSTFRPKSACSDVTKIDISKKKSDLQTKFIQILIFKFSSKVSNDARESIVIQDLIHGCGGGGVTSPVVGGLTCSDYFALAESAALLPCT